MSRRRVLAVAALLAVAVTAFARKADAHAIVRETTPAVDSIVPTSPPRVLMRFNEPVELAFGAIRVHDSEGRRVDEGQARHVGNRETVAVALEDGLPNGTYTVTWRVVSADGHPVDEAFVFHVGAPGERPEGIADELLGGEAGAGPLEGALAGAARWLVFVSLLVLVGAATCTRLLRLEADRLLAVAWSGAVAGTVAAFVLHGAVAGDLPLPEALAPDVMGDVARTRFGQVALARLALLAVVAVARRLWPVVAVAGAGLAATPGLAGHAGTTSPVALNVVADAVHVVAASVWVGGLAVLATRRRRLEAVARRFSDIAVVAVGALVVTGTYRAWVEVRSFDALAETYGRVLLAKVGVFLAMVALGYRNRRGARPRLVVAEVGAALVVVALTAVLVNLAPARVTAGAEGPFTAEVELGDYRLDVLVEPAEVGDNEVHLTAATATGAPAPVEQVQVLFRLPAERIGPLVADGVRLAPGHFVVQGRQVSVAGRWVLEIVARTGSFEERRARVAVHFD
jgi:copper transport protein